MLATIMQATFRRFGGAFEQLSTTNEPSPSCTGTLEQAVEHVVDETSARLRAIPGYSRRLREPVVTALRAIDEIVDQIPGVLSCDRAAFSRDAEVNAFFANYTRVQEVFSHSKEVRNLFDGNAGADHCFALLCMHRDERRQLGIDMDGEVLRKDVLQTTVSFSDHELVSPGLNELDARCSLKCCAFNALIGHIRLTAAEAHTRADDLEGRGQAWRARLKRETPGSPEHAALQREVQRIETERATGGPLLETLEDHFRHVADALSHPEHIISNRQISVFVDRLGLKHDGPDRGGARELRLSEIQIAGEPPRVACLVSFPRAELLPVRDFLREASIFLAA